MNLKKRILSFILVLAFLIISVPAITSNAASRYATLSVFSDKSPDGEGSSGHFTNLGNHSWITVKNESQNYITIGQYALNPGQTVSVGTWGNKNEHKGLWYNLEAYFVNQGGYDNRVSLSMPITPSQVNKLNILIATYDTWSLYYNCSSFAVNAWNEVAPYSRRLSAGFLGYTPKALYNSIKSKAGHQFNADVPLEDYVMYAGRYYANVSQEFN